VLQLIYFAVIDTILGVLLVDRISTKAFTSKTLSKKSTVINAIQLRKRLILYLVIWLALIYLALLSTVIGTLYVIPTNDFYSKSNFREIFNDIGVLLLVIEFCLSIEYFRLITALTEFAVKKSSYKERFSTEINAKYIQQSKDSSTVSHENSAHVEASMQMKTLIWSISEK
ncbi:hypothetical protein HK099_008526, partial [Clydaea vesicula]